MVPSGKVLTGRESHRRRGRCSPASLPPLFILSAVAVALAFPSALYLAGFACAEKVMNSLLGRPQEDGDDGSGAEIPVDEESPDGGLSSSAAEEDRRRRPPPQEVSMESRDIEVEEKRRRKMGMRRNLCNAAIQSNPIPLEESHQITICDPKRFLLQTMRIRLRDVVNLLPPVFIPEGMIYSISAMKKNTI